jgi:hypothetical protein
MFDPEMITWVDETGSARRNSVRSYGYSLNGMRAVSHELSSGVSKGGGLRVLEHPLSSGTTHDNSQFSSSNDNYCYCN